MRFVALILATGSMAIGLAACGGSGSSSGGAYPYAQAGPYAAGVTTIPMGFTTLDVWYPAPKSETAGAHQVSYDLKDWLPPSMQSNIPSGEYTFQTDAYEAIKPSTQGPFPLVIYAHGFAGNRDEATFLTSWLASWGFVVAAPDFPTHDLSGLLDRQTTPLPPEDQIVIDAIDIAQAKGKSVTGVLAGTVRQGKVALIGRGFGAIDIAQLSGDSNVVASVALAGSSSQVAASQHKAPLLMIDGSADQSIPSSADKAMYAKAPAPKVLATIPNAGSLGFTDICQIDPGKGGIMALLANPSLKVPATNLVYATAIDGCAQGQTGSNVIYPIVRQLVVSELRSAFGIDKSPVGLDKGVGKAFGAPGLSFQQSN